MEQTSISSNNIWLSHPDKTWENHINEVEKYSSDFISELPETTNLLINKNILKEIARIVALLHDLGKTTSYFQKYIKSRNPIKNEYTPHALLSALATYWTVKEYLSNKYLNEEEKEILPFLTFMVVKHHHRNLENIFDASYISENSIEILKKQWKNIEKTHLNNFMERKSLPILVKIIDNNIKNLPGSFRPKRTLLKYFRERDNFKYYFITNLLFSLLLDADKTAAGLGEFINNDTDIPYNLVDIYRKNMKWNTPDNLFDELRNKAYLEAINNISNEPSKDKYIFSLNIPTGFGKTFTALSIALRIMNEKKLNRIIYCLPFTSIIDQNYEEIHKLLSNTLNKNVSSSLLLKHHYLSDVFFNTDGKEYDTLESQLLIEGWNSKIITTTFIQFFHTLIGYRNRALRKFHRLANSIIILDEVQNIPFKYWTLLKNIISEFSKYFNSYFIISTATEPKIFDQKHRKYLVKPETYFKYLNRVKIYSNMDVISSLDDYKVFIQNKINNANKIMVVFNTINSAIQFYKTMKNEKYKLYFLSSHIIPKRRLEIIKKLINEKEYFLITTQIIEAGVNLDADIIFRDLGPLDSVNQVAGRCNRFAKNKIGKVYIVQLLDSNNNKLYSSYIYDKALLDTTRDILDNKNIQEKEFYKYCQLYFEHIERNYPQGESTKILEAVSNLIYDNDERAISNFKLINQDYEKYDIFIEADIGAQKTWQKYIGLKSYTDNWQRKKLFLQMKSDFYNYTISVGKKLLESNKPPHVGNIYYVPYDSLNQYYSIETGFLGANEYAIW